VGNIYIPRGGVQFHNNSTSREQDVARASLANICVRIPYKGFVISISCDDSCGCMDDLGRSDIRVYQNDQDVTQLIMKRNATWAEGESLKRAFRNIDEHLRSQA
jgi:hypothetical protein